MVAAPAQDEEARVRTSRQPTEGNLPAGQQRHASGALTLDLGQGVELKLMLIPAGSFQMGTAGAIKPMLEQYGGRATDYQNEYPQREKHVAEPFYIGTYEVTVEQFGRFVDATGYKTEAEQAGWCYAWRRNHWEKVAGLTWRAPGFTQNGDHPVVGVTWNDAVAFCRWMTEHTGRTVRLPRELEWEYACRAGTQTAYWWGDELDTSGAVANLADTGHWEKRAGLRLMPMDDQHQFTAPVGQYRGNPFGLHDMIGNAWEWCEDEYKPFGAGHRLEPVEPEGSDFRVLRGGSWGDEAWNCRSATRDWCRADARGHNAGFRVVAVPGRPETDKDAR
jgi:formylglycine-generating enzyme required for sulfatase activity